MAQIVKYTAQQGLNVPSIPNTQIRSYEGQALEGLGSAISRLGAAFADKEQKKEDFKAQDGYRKLQMRLGRDMEDQAAQMPEDGGNFHNDYMQQVYRPARDEFLGSVPARLRQRYETLLSDDGSDTEAWSIKAAERERDQLYNWYDTTLDASKEQLATAVAMDPEGYDRLLQQGFEEIEASGLPPSKKGDHRRRWEQMAQISHLNTLLETRPEEVLKALGADPRTMTPNTQYELLRKAVIQQESGGRADAISPAGAAGIMQVMPGTAKEIAREIRDPNFNQSWSDQQIREYLSNADTGQRYGDHYLKKMIHQFAGKGGLEAALVAYNGGPARAKRWIESGFNDAVLPKETRNYYKAIMKRLPKMGAGTAPEQKAEGGKFNPSNVKLNFNRKGLAALSGQDEQHLNPDLANRVKTAFAGLGIDQATIISGFRSPEDNARVKGAKGSQHMHGNAVDIDVSGYTHEERVKIIRALSASGVTGFGIGANVIHADVGGRRAWGYKDPSGGGSVPKWAQEAITEHLEKRAYMPEPVRRYQQFGDDVPTPTGAPQRSGRGMFEAAQADAAGPTEARAPSTLPFPAPDGGSAAAMQDTADVQGETGTALQLGPSERYATLPYNLRQQFIQKADAAVAKLGADEQKASATEKREMRSAVKNEIQSLTSTGQSTGAFDDDAVATILGEDAYARFVEDREKAQRIFTARDGIVGMTLEEMEQRLIDYEPEPGSATFAVDQQAHAAVQKEIDRVTRLRSREPAKAALEFDEVREAWDAVNASDNPKPEEVQTFVRLNLARQAEFNLKPGSEEPVPKEWSIQIGKALGRIPEIAGGNAADVRADILAQYDALYAVFGDYTDEVVVQALADYKGIGPNTGKLIDAFMKRISSGGDPFANMRPQTGDPLDMDQVEQFGDESGGFWSTVRDFIWGDDENVEGEAQAAAESDEAANEALDEDTIMRAVDDLRLAGENLSSQDDAILRDRYGDDVVDAALGRLGRQ